MTTKYRDYLQRLEEVVHMDPHAAERVAIFGRYIERQRALAADGKHCASYPVADA